MSARLEKEMGLGTDNESLASLKVGSANARLATY